MARGNDGERPTPARWIEAGPVDIVLVVMVGGAEQKAPDEEARPLAGARDSATHGEGESPATADLILKLEPIPGEPVSRQVERALAVGQGWFRERSLRALIVAKLLVESSASLPVRLAAEREQFPGFFPAAGRHSRIRAFLERRQQDAPPRQSRKRTPGAGS